MARRPHGDGSLFFDRQRARWVGTMEAGVRIDGQRRRIKVSGKTRQETREKLRRLSAAVESSLPLGDRQVRVSDFLEQWLARGLPSSAVSPNTIDNYAWAIHGHLIPALGHRRLVALTPADVDAMLREKAAAGLSRSSILRLHGTMLRGLRYAERHGMVARNVAALVDPPAGPTKSNRSLTAEQASRLLEASRGHRLEALFAAGLMLGLRPGELLGLTWTSVDFDARTLSVDQSLKRQRGELQIGPTKTPQSRRRLDMPSYVVEALRRHDLRQQAERLTAGRAWADLGLVFTTTLGSPIDPSNFRRDLAALTVRAGLGRWHPHELRHSAASLLSAAGVPLEQIADVLGHHGTRVTAEVYRHSVSPSVSAAAKPMDQLFGQN